MVQTDAQWKHALAGATGGLVTSLTLHPLELVKTRLQVQDGAGLLPAYRGTLHALRSILREEGWRALYSGLTPALAGNGLAWGIYFFAYNRAKERYRRYQGGSGGSGVPGKGGGAAVPPPAKLSPGMHLLSAAEAGAMVCFITNPIWVVKTRLMLQRRTAEQAAAGLGAAQAGPAAGAAAAAASGASIPRQLLGGVAGGAGGGGAAEVAAAACAVEYRSFLHAFVQIARCEGLRGLYKGLLPSLLLVSHGAIQFAAYEELKSAAANYDGSSFAGFTSSLDAGAAEAEGDGRYSSSSTGRRAASSSGKARGDSAAGSCGNRAQRQLSPAEITACGALAKLIASVATYPTQVVRSRLQQRMDARQVQYRGVLDVVRTTLRREGVGGLYKGLAPNVLRVMPQSALTFLVYESVMRLLQQQQP